MTHIYCLLLSLLFIAYVQCEQLEVMTETTTAQDVVTTTAATTTTSIMIVPEIPAASPIQFKNVLKTIYDILLNAETPINESLILPNADKVYTYNETSMVYRNAKFYANLCKTSNCRASLDKWDCDNCLSTLPDGKVIKGFQTYPLGVTGEIVRSDKNKAIYIILRGASSVRSKLLYSDNSLTSHPMVPGAQVQRGILTALFDIRDLIYTSVIDQITIYPTYTVEVVGHSFGSALGSLLMVDLYQRLPLSWSEKIFGHLFGKPRLGNLEYAKYIADNQINIKRYVERTDDIPHNPALKDGYMHEGDEYWLKSVDTNEVLVCLGPYETRNCSSSLNVVSAAPHLNYFTIKQDCDNDIFNLI